ncbi:MAG: hypothetical protein K2M17_01060 [Bacilli bacterium]|nr:hypothetical protein [Bacilli bacterium]
MCRSRKIWFSVLAFFCATSFVEAASLCDPSEVASLNREVANIKAGYEEIEKKFDVEKNPLPDTVLDSEVEENYVGTYSIFKVFIINLSENFYIEVSNDYNHERYTYGYKDAKDGVVSFEWENLDKVTNFTIKVYTSDKTGCRDELIKTITVITPRLNEYYDYSLCKKVEEYSLCNKYVQYGEVDFQTFIKNITKHIENKEAAERKKEEDEDFVKKYGFALIVGAIVIVGITTGVVVVIVRKHRSSDKI